MAYVNTGYQRATNLTIKTYVNGSLTNSDVISPDLTSGFTYNGNTYTGVTTTQIQQMSFTDYNNRVTDYAGYVQSNYQTQYPGLTVYTNGSYVTGSTCN